MASTEKYDRQLRLWGRNGQKALVESRLLLLGASCTGSETLKNLVLPGCGCITIVDDAIVNEGDVSSNFFTRTQDIGRPRAEVVKELMCEMNPDTQSSEHVVQSPVDYITSKNGNFQGFTLVIATQLPAPILRQLGKACSNSGVPLLVVRTYGLIGYLRVVLPRCDHPIVQDHKTNDTSDQWIRNPWPELVQWRDSFDLDAQNTIDHMHTPWPVILHHLLARYQADHGEAAFKNLTRATLGEYVLQCSMTHRMKLYQAEVAQKTAESPEPEDPRQSLPPLNYVEAKNRCYKALQAAEVPYELAKVLKDPRASSSYVSSSSGSVGTSVQNSAAKDNHATFWIVMQAINRFMANEGRGFLPVTGTVVDLTASSLSYIAMQTKHQEKHVQDIQSVTKHISNIAQECGIDVATLRTVPFADDLNMMVSVVLKNVREISLRRTTTLEEEYTNTGIDSNGDPQPATTLGEAFMMAPFNSEADKEMLGALWYVMLRACDRFWQETGKFPGSDPTATEEALKSDVVILLKHAKEIQSDLGYMWDVGYEKAAQEMTRYGGSEVHTVAAYIGGIAGQEAVKLISHQYTPMNSTYIYNGINGSAGSYMF
jgi:amyloid beta precursor protein binding protein 1